MYMEMIINLSGASHGGLKAQATIMPLIVSSTPSPPLLYFLQARWNITTQERCYIDPSMLVLYMVS